MLLLLGVFVSWKHRRGIDTVLDVPEDGTREGIADRVGGKFLATD